MHVYIQLLIRNNASFNTHLIQISYRSSHTSLFNCLRFCVPQLTKVLTSTRYGTLIQFEQHLNPQIVVEGFNKSLKRKAAIS